MPSKAYVVDGREPVEGDVVVGNRLGLDVETADEGRDDEEGGAEGLGGPFVGQEGDEELAEEGHRGDVEAEVDDVRGRRSDPPRGTRR